MNLILTRKISALNGIWGELHAEDGSLVAYTLEHSFDCLPKLAVGTYVCVRGIHKLASRPDPFVTFEVKNVPDFQGKPVTGILFHRGNWNEDSEGCILVGSSYANGMLSNSALALDEFLSLQDGVDSFNLVVK